MTTPALPYLVALFVTLAATTATLTSSATSVSMSRDQTPSTASPALAASTGSIALGVRTDGAPGDSRAMDAFAARIGRQPEIWTWYEQWSDLRPFVSRADLDAVQERGAVPMVSWEPWDPARSTPQPRFALRYIASGALDAYLHQSARIAAAWKRPLLIRFAPEMNLHASPWGPRVNGNSPEAFVAAWRRVVRVFRSEGATNVRWVWAPNILDGSDAFDGYYPGDAWVDWIALDGFNWGESASTEWKSPWEVFGTSYRSLVALSDKPVMISETGSAERGGSKAGWIRSLSELPRRMPRVRALVWFDRDKEVDWRVSSSPSALRAFRRLIASPPFGSSLRLGERRSTTDGPGPDG